MKGPTVFDPMRTFADCAAEGERQALAPLRPVIARGSRGVADCDRRRYTAG